MFSLHNGLSFFSSDVDFYEFVFPFKLTSKSDRISKFLESSFVNNNDPWDPFSTDEILLSESLDDNQGYMGLNVNNQDGDVSVEQPMSAIESGVDGSLNLGATIHGQEGTFGCETHDS